MYVGIGPNRGKEVLDSDAIEYAAKSCGISIDYEKQSLDAKEFKEIFLEWFYSGEWIHETERN